MPHLELKYEGVQTQQGGSDCGVFAIANIVEVLSGGNPSKVNFNTLTLLISFLVSITAPTVGNTKSPSILPI